MALTSASTVATALAQYNDNLAYDGNLTKALAALEAVRFLLMNRAKIMSEGAANLHFEELAEERKRLVAFVNAASTTARTNRSSFTRGRML